MDKCQLHLRQVTNHLMNDIRSIPVKDLRQLGNQGFALALRILRHREDAADAVQDAMHQLFRKQHFFDSQRGSVRSWFLRIVRNRCIDMRRKARPSTGSEQFDPVDRGGVSPTHATEQQELVAAVHRALDEMNLDAREIILLRDSHGLSYAEIGEVLDIAAGTVMSRLHRARQQLRDKVMSTNPSD